MDICIYIYIYMGVQKPLYGQLNVERPLLWTVKSLTVDDATGGRLEMCLKIRHQWPIMIAKGFARSGRACTAREETGIQHDPSNPLKLKCIETDSLRARE